MRPSAAAALAARIVPAWEKLRASPPLKGAFLFAVSALLVLAGSFVPSAEDSVVARAERGAYDLQMRFLRERFPRPLPDDVVLVGIDDATEQAFPEPIALWHHHFAKLYRGLAAAQPRAVGIDIGLPERSFEGLVKGIDAPMMMGLVALKSRTRLVFVQHVSAEGKTIPIQENYRRHIVTPEHLGIDRQFRDVDGVSRRFAEDRAVDDGSAVPSFAGQLLRLLGMAVTEGTIDYSTGVPRIAYVPLHEAVAWQEAGDVGRLRAAFGGKVVLVGSLTIDRDRWPLPVRLIELKEGQGYSQPGVLIHLQVLRNHLSTGVLRPLPEALRWVLCAMALLAVFVRARPVVVVIAAAAAVAALVAASLVAIRQVQVLLPLAAIGLSFLAALLVRLAFDAVESAVERIRLERTFTGQVSPAVMKEMLAGGLATGVNARLAEVCVLFSDIRGFTALTEEMPPAIVTQVLQRYFDRMVHAVHRFDGTVDKFIGDGMMVLFGAPRASADPCGDAVRCALEMMNELDALNAQFSAEGLPTLVIGIGVNYGTVTVGNIGSSARYNYSAIGDAVNVAARIEGLTKDLGRKILITESVVSRIGEAFQFEPLGEHPLKGHSPVRIWGIRTARAAPSA